MDVMMRKILRFRSIRAKMLFGFSLVILLVIILSAYNFFAIFETNKDTKYLADEEVPLLLLNEELAYHASQQMAAIRGYVLFSDDEYIDQFYEHVAASEQLQEEILQLTNATVDEQLVEQSREWSAYIEAEVIENFQKGNRAGATIHLDEGELLAQEIIDGLGERTDVYEANFNNTTDDIVSSGEMTLTFSIVVSVLAIIIGIITAIITANSIARPIRRVMERMNIIAGGDFSQKPLETKLIDEVGQLITATNEMTANMQSLLKDVNDVSKTVNHQSNVLMQSAQEVSEGSDQIASAMQDLASGSEVQANQAGELTEIMTVFDKNIRDANENSKNVANFSDGVLKMTTAGKQLMGHSTEQMNAINEIVMATVNDVQNLNRQSQKISELVLVIEDIAEQTNLLALNAAIEAARAGEHGYGFAVVAEEVRNLAEEVSESVVDITTIVSGIQSETEHVTQSLQSGQTEVAEGTTQMVETDETFNSIAEAVENMTSNINIVTNNLTEIVRESEQMNRSIEEISATFEQSAASIEETSAATEQSDHTMQTITTHSKDLSKLADELNDLVLRFKI